MAYCRRVELVLANMVLVVAALLGQATAQSGCTNAIINLAPCLNYIRGSSSTPSSNCCSQLSNIVQSSPQCLCSVLNGGAASFGITINQTLALTLPGACQVNTPPLSRCQSANAPSGSTIPPQSAPADSPSETPEAALTPSASDNEIPSGGSKSVPSTDSGSSDGSGVRASMSLALLLFFVLSCSSTFTT